MKKLDKYKELKEPHTGIGFGVIASSGAGGNPFIEATGGDVSAGTTIDTNYNSYSFINLITII